MKITISINNKKIEIILEEKRKVIDRVQITDEHSLSLVLLPVIDTMLAKNKLKKENIECIEVETDQTDSFTTTRIAKAVANAWNRELY